MFAYSVALALVVLVGTGSAFAAEPKVYEEQKLLYTDIKDGKTTWIQTATQFFPVKAVASIPTYMDIYGITKGQNDIRSFVVVRSSFYVPLSLSEIRQRIVNPLALSKYSKHFKVLSCAGRACSASIKTTFANLSLKLTHGQVDKNEVTAPWLNVFASLHQPDFVAAQEFTDIEAVFDRGSNFSAFYKMGPNLTWVQSYQLFSIKNSAYEKVSYIPFFNLEKNIRGVIQDLILDARSSILRE